MNVNTHPAINPDLCGTPISLEEGRAVVRLITDAPMVADEHGLVHGGFIFGLADYAAMLAVNDPLVVLGAAECRFTAPVREGEIVIATATRQLVKGKKQVVEVDAKVGERSVFTGSFTTFVLDKHVLAG